MIFTDTHTHLYDEAFEGPEEQDRAVSRAIEAGVTRMIIPDNSSRERAALTSLCSRWPRNLSPCLGVHPTELGKDWKMELDMLENLADRIPASAGEAGIRPAAIGETGMDLYWDKSEEARRRQEIAFRLHLDIALAKNLPLIIHAREATDSIFRILDDYRGRGLKGVFHAFSGSIETFRRIETLGDWMVGIGGVLTFKRAGIAETVRDIPLERIVLETDSPYLTPVPHRGQRNESSFIPIIAKFLAGSKSVDLSEVAATTTKNAEILFSI